MKTTDRPYDLDSLCPSLRLLILLIERAEARMAADLATCEPAAARN
jgi:hypothetical protein